MGEAGGAVGEAGRAEVQGVGAHRSMCAPSELLLKVPPGRLAPVTAEGLGSSSVGNTALTTLTQTDIDTDKGKDKDAGGQGAGPADTRGRWVLDRDPDVGLTTYGVEWWVHMCISRVGAEGRRGGGRHR